MARYDVSALYGFDREFESYGQKVIGIDEAGRGPLAGPVVAAAVMLDLENPINGIFDSKKVAPGKRIELYGQICSKAGAWAVGLASEKEIDRYNILQATFLAMQRAIDGISKAWTIALVDGNQYIPTIQKSSQKAVVKGDGLSASIAAASIIAKVTRDRIMEEYDSRYPLWKFATHKGYPTAEHREIIGRIGICEIHRKTFCTRFVKGTNGTY
jgi:ribonuclease HII